MQFRPKRRVINRVSSQQQTSVNDDDPPLPAVGWLWDRKAAQTRDRLREQRLRPKKSLGQNFMLDDGILATIVDKASIKEGDAVLEIGPGTGNLTRHLLAAGAHVVSVEKDTMLYESLCKEFESTPNIHFILGDILRQNLTEIVESMPGDSVYVVANVPYNITKDLLTAWLPKGGTKLKSLHLMLQHEVGERLTNNAPGSSDWRVMNLITQYYSEAKYVFRIDKKKYHPVPKVDGALVEFKLLPPEDRIHVPNEKKFIQLMKKAFSQKRKMMKNSMQPLVSGEDVASALDECRLNVDARAQDLTIEQFAQLAWKLHEICGY